MKFLQTINGNFINVDEILKIEHVLCQISKRDRYYSYLTLKDGSREDFLDVPDEFGTEDGKYRLFSEDFIILWHQIVLEDILNSHHGLILIDDVMEDTWPILMKAIMRKEMGK